MIKNKKLLRNDILGSYSKNEILYQYSKLRFLEENEYLEKVYLSPSKYTGEQIKYSLANTSQISFEVTDKCNLSCEYCIYGKYYTNREKPQNRKLNPEIAKEAINYLVKLWNSPINSSHKKQIFVGFYGGEALLNFKFIHEIVSYTKKINLKHNYFKYTITTNGVLLDKHMSFFAENDFNLLISLDGETEYNNSYRKYADEKSAFNDIYKNILLLQEAYPVYFEKNVNFISVLHNKNSFPKLYSFFLEKFNKTPLISQLDTDSINHDLEKDFSEMYQSMIESIKEDISFNKFENKYYIGNVENLTSFLFRFSGYRKSSLLGIISNNIKTTIIPTGTCNPFSRLIFVKVNGVILPCERIGHQHALGYIDETGVKLDFDKIAEKYNNHFNHIQNICSDCLNEFKCDVCMFKQNLESDDFNCSSFKSYSQMIEYFSNQMTYVELRPKLYTKIMTKIDLI